MEDIEGSVEMTTDGLDKFIKALKMEPPEARVGILGSKAARSKGENNNATIGAAHEFGTETLPIRSFLRVPIAENLDKYLENSGAFDADALAQVMKQKSLIPWYKKMVVVAERIVLDGFDTAGFGKWKPSNMKDKKNHQTLVETKQLRDSITSEVK